MAITYTKDQQKVIDLHGKNILVSAAAGSGKTAVLVERIVQMIANREHPVDIDRLLVVTFTNMAAGEMRERIGLAIGKRLETEPENEHLQRQMTLLHNAQITTIDSFCLFVLRNHFHMIGLDPGFRVADEGELKLLAQDVMGSLLEEWYEESSPAFLESVEYFTTGSRDKLLEEYISKLYTFAMSFPWPEEWLMERKTDYAILSVAELEQSQWGQFLLSYTGEVLKGCEEEIVRCIRISEQPDGPYMYGKVLEEELQMLSNANRATTLQEYAAAWETLGFGRLPSKKDDSVSVEKRELVQSIRKMIKDVLKETGQRFFNLPMEQAVARMGKMKEAADVLVDLTLDYKKRLDAAKREKNLIDFGDMEHFALSILLEKGTEGYIPTAAAAEMREHFVEILTDEYQDSNMVQELLLESISGRPEGRFNRFMVGDVKQSIYKFRLARPEIFMEKYDCYPLTDESDTSQRIDLRQNFRSRAEVLCSVNYVFERIMQKSLGGVEYNSQAALYLGAAYPEKAEAERLENKTELLLLHTVEEGAEELLAEETPREMEARMIARRIKELVGSFQVTDKESGELRPAHYLDMVILLRTTAGWDEIFKKVLEEEGVPIHMSAKTGYFAAVEIQTILQVIRILDNPLQDIPMVGVMKSFFGGFNEEEIAKIQAERKSKEPFFQKLKWMAKNHPDEKLSAFLTFVEKYRRKSVYTPIKDLLKELIIESGYYHNVAVRPAGEQRIANLEMLLAKAASFAQTSYYGLFHFVRYIEQLEKYDVDYGEANILDEQADVVRLMSIHKSKGLEFPICFVAGLSKGFNMQDTYSGMIADVDLGIGVDYVNTELRVQSRSLRKNVISQKMKLDNLGEELRVLYVAMTRAKEKLILSATAKKLEAMQSAAIQREDGRLSFLEMTEASNYLDLLLPVIMEEEAGACFDLLVRTPEDLFMEEVKEDVKRTAKYKELVNRAYTGEMPLSRQGKESVRMLSEKFARKYARPDLAALYTKTTVSELKKSGQEESGEVFVKRLFEEPEVVPYIPLFMKEQEDIIGTVRGSAYHKVMELLCFRKIPAEQRNVEVILNEIKVQTGQALAEGKLSKEYQEAVRDSKIADFLKTSLAARMIAADRQGKLYKEQPFVIGLNADRLSEEFSTEETILIQGIIDVFFEEDGELVVMDYKTDAVKTPIELLDRYRKQLDYYEEALEQLTGKTVKEKIIYSFALNKEIQV